MGSVWCGVWYGVVWFGEVLFGAAWCGVWYGVVSCGVLWRGLVWCGWVWRGAFVIASHPRGKRGGMWLPPLRTVMNFPV